MALPVHSTTITVLRPAGDDPYAEPYAGPPVEDAVAAGVRAVIDVSTFGMGAGTEILGGGEQTRTLLRLLCDPVDLHRLDRVRDERTDAVYRVVWLTHYATGTSDEHVQAAIEVVEGLV